jgi:acylphosphatase
MTAEQTDARLYLVSGRVQGVRYRFFVEREAQVLGITGYVRNLYDGRVEVYALGSRRSLEKLRRQLESGPPGARVERVEQHEASRRDRKGFVIDPSGPASI